MNEVRLFTAEQIGSAPQFRRKTVEDELPVEQFFEMPEPQRVVELVEVRKIVAELAVSSGEVGSSSPGKRDTTDVADAAVEVPVGEARPPGISQYSTTTESDVEGSSGEAGSSWPGADDTTSADVDATVARNCW